MEHERKIYDMLQSMWQQVYHAEQELGEDHEQYKALSDLCMEIVRASCGFHKYLPFNQEPDRQEPEIKKPTVTSITMSN